MIAIDGATTAEDINSRKIKQSIKLREKVNK